MEEKPAEAAAAEEAEEEPKASLFPLFPTLDASRSQQSSLTPASVPQWLSNSSFTADLSIINDAVSNLTTTLSNQLEPDLEEEEEEEEERLKDKRPETKPPPSYDYLESSSESERDRRNDIKRKQKRKRKRSKDRGGPDDYCARKSDVRAWAGSETKPSKDYYFDSRGDPDNLAFGGLYRYSSLILLHVCLQVQVLGPLFGFLELELYFLASNSAEKIKA